MKRIQLQLMSPHDAAGGGARHALGLSRALARIGPHVELLCTGGPKTPIAAGARSVVQPIVCSPRSLPVLWRFNPLGTFPWWVNAIRERAADVDAVVALSPVMALATRRALPRMPVLYCPTVLDRVEHPNSRASLLQWFEKLALRRSHALLFPAHATQDAAAALYGPLRRPSAVRPLGVDAGDIPTAGRGRCELGVPDGVPLLLTVGLVNENKGQRHILEALRLMTQRDWTWAVVGDGPDLDELRETARRAGLKARVRLAGSDPAIGDWLAAADVLIACSRHETFGLAIAEALAVGLPVILPRDNIHGPSSRAGWALSPLADVVQHGRLGHTFDRGDAASLAGAVAGLLDDPAERRAMSARAAAHARGEFRWDRYAAAALKLLAGLSARSGRRATDGLADVGALPAFKPAP